jgi:hypothetical protein
MFDMIKSEVGPIVTALMDDTRERARLRAANQTGGDIGS